LPFDFGHCIHILGIVYNDGVYTLTVTYIRWEGRPWKAKQFLFNTIFCERLL